jgi:hypothetical protein
LAASTFFGFGLARASSLAGGLDEEFASLKEKRCQRVVIDIGTHWQVENEGSKAGAFFAWGFFGAKFLVEEVADLFDEDDGEEFLRAVGGEVNLAGVPTVTAPEAGHVGGGKCVTVREEGQVRSTEGVDVLEGGRPVQARAEDALQIDFCGGLGGPKGERLQNFCQVNRGHSLGEFGSRHSALDSYIGKMFKKERMKWDFLAK